MATSQSPDPQLDKIQNSKSSIGSHPLAIITFALFLFIITTLWVLSGIGKIPGSWSATLSILFTVFIPVFLDLIKELKLDPTTHHPMPLNSFSQYIVKFVEISLRIWGYFITEPFTFIINSFFRPIMLQQEIESVKNTDFRKHFSLIVRLALPMFVVSYLPGLLVHILYKVFSGAVSFGSSADFWNLFVVTAESSIVPIAFAIPLSIAWRTTGGIAFGIAGAIVGDIPVGIAGGFIRLAALDITANIPVGIAEGATKFIVLSILVSIGLGILGFFAGSSTRISTGLALCFSGLIVIFLLGLIGITTIPDTTETIIEDAVLGTMLGLILGDSRFIIIGILLGFSGFLTGDIWTGIWSGLAFVISYAVGHYRLPLYPISGLSWYKVYIDSKKKPSEVFTYLKRRSLYWDELVYLPLPGLRTILVKAFEQDQKKAWEVAKFITKKRPQQIGAVQTDLLKIIMHNLEAHQSLEGIAQASELLETILLAEVDLISRPWVEELTHLNYASKKAAPFLKSNLSESEKREQLKALQEMIGSLNTINPDIVSNNADLTKLLKQVCNSWQTIAQRKHLEIILGNLEQYKTLQDIALSCNLLNEVLPIEIGLIDHRWVKPLTHLNNTSKEAARYLKLSESERQEQRKALQEMLGSLNTINLNEVSNNADPTNLLERVVKKWRTTAQLKHVEIILDLLEICESLHDIALSCNLFNEVLPIEIGLVHHRWVKPLNFLNDVSKEAACYFNLPESEGQNRLRALQEMVRNLRAISPDAVTKNTPRKERLNRVIDKWRVTIEREQVKAS